MILRGASSDVTAPHPRKAVKGKWPRAAEADAVLAKEDHLAFAC